MKRGDGGYDALVSVMRDCCDGVEGHLSSSNCFLLCLVCRRCLNWIGGAFRGLRSRYAGNRSHAEAVTLQLAVIRGH